ncbi:MAG: Mur ligase family protein [Patescibacteria group bacterium]
MFSEFQPTYDEFLSLTNLSTQPMIPGGAGDGGRSIKRTAEFLNYLGNPEKKMRFIHIAGTSGKGTVAFLIHQMLRKDRQTVGTYISPHTTSYLERFQVNDKLIDPYVLAQCMKDLATAYERYLPNREPLTFFELSTCLALYAFAELKLTWCILESGCGGRYDSTNVIPAPDIAIITNIDKDHMELLGNSLASIASHKAGIMKAKSTVFCGETRPALKKIFTQEAIKKSCALFFVPPPLELKIQPQFGFHMQHNAALAERAGNELDLSPQSISAVLSDFRTLPCRFEMLSEDPLLIIDGAHNPAKIHATVERLRVLGKPIHLIFGCGANKDASLMLKELSKITTSITTTRYRTTYKKASNPLDLQKFVPTAQRGGAYLRYEDAWEAVKNRAKKTDVIVITGSLYLAGEMRGLWVPEQEILENQSSFPL